MTSQPLRKMEELTPPDIELLTQLLSLNPGEVPTVNWLEDQSNCISNFLDTLLKRSSLVPFSKLNPFRTERAVLCDTHRVLNPYLIRDIFRAVSAECTSRQSRLEPKEFLPDSLAIFLSRLQKINSLWLSPQVYNQTFGAKITDARCEFITSGCEPCILAAVGGNTESICDLRISILGRKKPHHPPDHLLPLLEAWLDWTGRGDELRKESKSLVKEIRHFRRLSQKSRRRERGSTAKQMGDEGVVGSETWVIPEQEVIEGDEVENVVEYYSQRMSRDTMKKGNISEGIHPAFRDSIVFCAKTGTFLHKQNVASSPQINPRPSLGGDVENEMMKPREPSVEYASIYRDLIGATEMEEESDDSGGRGCIEGEEMRASRWDRGNFF